MALTKRQKEVLDFLAGFIAENHYSPSFEEIAHGMGLASIATVHKHLSSLEQKGYLKRSFNQSRALDISPKYYRELRDNKKKIVEFPRKEQHSTPLVGTIAAGQPIEAFENHDSVSFAPFIDTDGVYALEVRGQSMIDDHIMDGDYVLVEKTQQARNGEIVVALVGGSETTLKRFYLEGSEVRLQPANSEMAPIMVPADQVQIQGRVLAVHRRYN